MKGIGLAAAAYPLIHRIITNVLRSYRCHTTDVHLIAHCQPLTSLFMSGKINELPWSKKCRSTLNWNKICHWALTHSALMTLCRLWTLTDKAAMLWLIMIISRSWGIWFPSAEPKSSSFLFSLFTIQDYDDWTHIDKLSRATVGTNRPHMQLHLHESME